MFLVPDGRLGAFSLFVTEDYVRCPHSQWNWPRCVAGVCVTVFHLRYVREKCDGTQLRST